MKGAGRLISNSTMVSYVPVKLRRRTAQATKSSKLIRWFVEYLFTMICRAVGDKLYPAINFSTYNQSWKLVRFN